MKNPFAILLAGAVLIGILITVVVFLVLGTSDDEGDGSIQVASRSELPTPSTRSENLVREDARAVKDGDAIEPTVAPPSGSDDEASTQPTETPTEAPQTSTSDDGQTVQGRGGGGFGAGGPGGNRFQAIQDAMADNPEVAELFEKAQAGTITQEEQARMRELMQELLAEAGIEAPGGQGGGFGAPPIMGTISTISGYSLTVDLADDSGSAIDIAIADDTDITVVKELTTADLVVGATVVGAVQRGEGGRIVIVNLTVLSEQQRGGFGGGFRGLGAATGGASNTATNVSNVEGTIAEINDQTISVETTQGTLRLTANDESNIVSTSSGTVGDITEGMAVIAFGGNQGVNPAQAGSPIQPRSLIVGPDALLQTNQGQ